MKIRNPIKRTQKPSNTASQIISGSTKKSASRSRLLAIVAIIAVAVIGAAVYQKYGLGSRNFIDCSEGGGQIVTNEDKTVCTDKSGNKYEVKPVNEKSGQWKIYSEGKLASFTYPPDWKIEKLNTSAAYKGSESYSITSPDDTTLLTASTANERALQSFLTIIPSAKKGDTYKGKVLATKEFLFVPTRTGAKLLAVDSNNNQKADIIFIGPTTANVGDDTVAAFFEMNSQRQLALQAQIVKPGVEITNKNYEQYEAQDATAALNSKSVSSLVLLLSNFSLK